MSAWQSLGLSQETLSSLARLKFSRPTPIQRSTIPEIVAGHDVIGKGPTGSGKTLAFGIPIYEHYLKTREAQHPSAKSNKMKPEHQPIALIVSPTRELAHQLSTHITDLCSNPNSPTPSIATVTGGLSVHKQQRQLTTADIIVGTPGRLWEVINGSHLSTSLKKIKFLVVDEADRLLSEGHFKEMQEILNVLDRSAAVDEGDEDESTGSEMKRQRQTLVFSATFQKDLQQKLAGKGKSFGTDLIGEKQSMEYLLKKLSFREEKPKSVDVNPISQMASGLKEGLVECAGTDKVGTQSVVKSSEYLLTSEGSLSLFSPPALPTHPHSYLHQLHNLSPPPNAIPPEPQPTSLRSPLTDAAKSPPPVHRTLLLARIPSFHASSH